MHEPSNLCEPWGVPFCGSAIPLDEGEGEGGGSGLVGCAAGVRAEVWGDGEGSLLWAHDPWPGI